ncbi:ATP-binding protein [Salinibacterium sp. ZJ454]|uniref:ATP-binding protein n=1 Tax=Salinibacterium sp. ZJ454 TaxID=2708339 RepID=UPI00141EF737|nr:ATP-binding protein [Salinibacterium sp. ZJ454]
MTAFPVSRTSLTLRVARWVGAAAVPTAFPANVGCYILALYLLDGTRAHHMAQTEAWQLVTVFILITGQAFWLVWLRRQALGTVIASLLLWQVAVLVGGYDALAVQPGVLLAVYSYSAERPGPRRAAVILGGIVLTTGVLIAAYMLHAPDGAPAWNTPAVLTAWALIAIVTIGLPALGGGWYAQLRDRAERIADLAQKAASGEAVRTAEAVSAERRTLAQEIHDTSSAHLAALLALTTAAQTSAVTGGPAHERLIEQIRGEGERLYQGFERMLSSMLQEDRTITEHHQPGHRAGQHAAAEVAELVQEHRRTTGVPVALHHEPALTEIGQRLGPMRSHIAYRVVQEALSNARKHSAGAPITVTVEDDGTTLLLRIENETAPRPPAGASGHAGGVAPRSLSLGYGLEGMRDRLMAAGGSLRTGPRQNGGWSVNALLPHPPHQRSGDYTVHRIAPPEHQTAPPEHQIVPRRARNSAPGPKGALR